MQPIPTAPFSSKSTEPGSRPDITGWLLGGPHMDISAYSGYPQRAGLAWFWLTIEQERSGLQHKLAWGPSWVQTEGNKKAPQERAIE